MFFDIGFRSFISCFLLIPASVSAAEHVSPGRIIILDGMSNAGKTSVAKHLLPLLDSSYVCVTLDDYVTGLWLQKRNGYLPEQKFVERVHHRVDTMYDGVRSLLLAGNNVLLDTIISGLAGEDDSWRCFEKLNGLCVFMVLVYCPLPVVVERMHRRNEDALLFNKPGRVRPIVVSAKFGDLYRVAQEGDVVLGVLTREDVERAYETPCVISDQEKNLYMKLRNDLVSQFDLHERDEVEITPCLQHDCIVNTNTCTPAGCAKKIYDSLRFSNVTCLEGHDFDL